MYFLNKFCFICMNKDDLKHLFDVDSDGVSHYNKLTSSIAEMNFKEMNDQRLICGECCVTLNTVYNFRQACLRGKTNLITYISQLQTFGHVSGTLSVCLTDIKDELIVVKEEQEIKCENDDDNSQSMYQTESYGDSFSASVKEECESEEDASFAHEATADRINEDAHFDVKVEEVEDQTMMKDGHYVEFTKIEIEEDWFAKIKQEPMSDSVTQDGSTSQAGTSGKSKERKKTKIRTRKTSKSSKERQFICDLCGRNFTNKSNLQRHVRIHSGERPYTCEICEKNFNLKCNLTRHLVTIHFGDGPHECEICKKSFNSHSSVRRHMRVHFGGKQYTCKLCEKNFNHNFNLTRHMRLHSSERQYT